MLALLLIACSYIWRTLTKPVKLMECLKSIKEYAFCASEYPVVITLEDHLTPDLRAKVADVSAIFCIWIYWSLAFHPKKEKKKRN